MRRGSSAGVFPSWRRIGGCCERRVPDEQLFNGVSQQVAYPDRIQKLLAGCARPRYDRTHPGGTRVTTLPQLGDVFQLEQAFLEEGPLPAAILSVTLDGGAWRLTELQGNLPFTIEQAD